MVEVLCFFFVEDGIFMVWSSLYMILQGFAIGNGLTDPAIQYKAYPDYALDMGLITKTQFNRINKIVPTCEFAVKLCGKSCFNCVYISSSFCLLALQNYQQSSMFLPQLVDSTYLLIGPSWFSFSKEKNFHFHSHPDPM